MNRATTLSDALTNPELPVGTMIPVRSADLPADIRSSARRVVLRSANWQELYQPSARDGGCSFGCKVYARQQGAVVRFAVHHSLSYGHSHSPNAR